mmetsp:Transcript_33153/g.58064  ORF Transcript_33153/g.58064 Transcript_33153/m.58064 type:complete len:136 (+) Transcript_33153:154-561(+)
MVQWTRLYDSAQRALQDEEEEADMKRINQNIAELLNHSNPAPPPFNASQYASELDYFTELMYRAKLHPYRAELLWLIGKWMDGEAPFREPLHRVEVIGRSLAAPPLTLHLSRCSLSPFGRARRSSSTRTSCSQTS